MMEEQRVGDRKAREILERAAEIDRASTETVSVETLRAAAREAGIAESSFDAALMEQSRSTARDHAAEARRHRLMQVLAAAGGGGLLLLGLTLLSRLFP